MSTAIKIQIGVIILCIAEAWLEVIVIKLKDPNLPDYTSLNRKEHLRSAVYYLAMICLFILISWDVSYRSALLVLVLLFHRRIWFEYSLKFMRKKDIKRIEGDQMYDRFSRAIYGANGGYWELLFMVLVVAVANTLL